MNKSKKGGKAVKRWLKKHGKWVVVGLGVLSIANGTWGIFTATEEWKVVFHACVIILWSVIVLLASGALRKFFDWWERD